MVPDAPLRFAGYAALFHVPDGTRDMIRPGAFAATLAARTQPLPLLWQHRSGQKLGVIETIAEDARGLKVVARIERTRTRGARLLQQGKVSGLSFGFRAREAVETGRGRTLLAIDLFEISLVTHPLQHGARVHLVT
ncbi:MAG: HK97 family phage prohead protease [Erythrobacter sp.]